MVSRNEGTKWRVFTYHSVRVRLSRSFGRLQNNQQREDQIEDCATTPKITNRKFKEIVIQIMQHTNIYL